MDTLLLSENILPMAITVKYNFEGFKSLGVLQIRILMQMQRANAIREKRKLRSHSCSPSLRKQGVYKRVYATYCKQETATNTNTNTKDILLLISAHVQLRIVNAIGNGIY